ncbi:AMP-binding protein [Marinibacterium sp. SX1]|uniref:AMP-binding protein n=1 Tax=Marinibacterium sp. SX1 TaxID=3388424 RepID=UPI003D16B494
MPARRIPGLRSDGSWDLGAGLNMAAQALAGPPGDTVIIDMTGPARVDISRGELTGMARGLALYLAGRGVGRGDRVGVLLSQSPWCAAAHLGIWMLGAVSVPLFKLFKREALASRIGDAGLTLVLTDAEGAGLLGWPGAALAEPVLADRAWAEMGAGIGATVDFGAGTDVGAKTGPIAGPEGEPGTGVEVAPGSGAGFGAHRGPGSTLDRGLDGPSDGGSGGTVGAREDGTVARALDGEAKRGADGKTGRSLDNTEGQGLDGKAGHWPDGEAQRAPGWTLPDMAVTGPEDPAVLIYTSGTTGRPKGALHGHRLLTGHLPGVSLSHDHLGQPGDVLWTPADWAWIGGLFDVLMPGLALGVPVVAARMAKFDALATRRLVEAAGVRNVFFPPTALRLLKAADATLPGLRSVASGGEPLGAEMLAWGRRAFGLEINEFYGQTECNMIVSSCGADHPARPGCAGRVVPGHAVEVIDAEGRPTGDEGDIAVRRGSASMFLGYWRNPDETARKFRGDWMLTGDRGCREGEHIRFVGRDDDVITSAGYRIGPAEIEDCLLTHPAVATVGVVGKPDPLRTEIVKAYVVLKPGYAARPSSAARDAGDATDMRDLRAAADPPGAVRHAGEAAGLPGAVRGAGDVADPPGCVRGPRDMPDPPGTARDVGDATEPPSAVQAVADAVHPPGAGAVGTEDGSDNGPGTRSESGLETGAETGPMDVSTIGVDELQDWVKDRLAAYSYPREIAFVDALPMTVTGKVVRRDLRARAAAETEKVT